MSPNAIPSRARRVLWVAAALLVLYTVVGFFIAPLVVRAQLQKRLTALLDRPVTIEKVRLNPYALSATLLNLDIRERDGRGSFLGWKRLYVNFDALKSLFGEWVLGDIALDGFHAQVTVKRDGTYNFSDLLKKFGAPPPAGAPPAKPSRPLRIVHLAVSDSRVDFADHSRPKPFQTTIGPLSFTLTGFRTAGGSGAPYHFEAVTEVGEKLAWTGTLSADPVQSAGEFSLENIDLPKYAPYYDQAMRAEIATGTLAVHGHYRVDLDPRARALTLTDGGLSLRNLKVTERTNGLPAVELKSLDIAGLSADGMAMKAHAGRVALRGGHLSVRRDKDGTINLLAMLPPPEPARPVTAGAAASAPPTPPLDLTVGEVALNDFAVDVADLAAPRPAHLGLRDLQGSLRNVSLADGAVMPLQLAFAWAPQGTVHCAGTVSIRPAVRVALKTDVAGLAILPLSPYLEQFVNARITGGTVSTTNEVRLALADGRPDLTLNGDVGVEKFGLVDGVHSEPLAGFAALALTGLKATVAGQTRVSLAEVKVDAPYARVVVDKEKALNLAAVAKPAGAPSAPPAATSVIPTARSNRTCRWPSPSLAGRSPACRRRIRAGRRSI
jgi:Domain of Unknown Function (DUF748)